MLGILNPSLVGMRNFIENRTRPQNLINEAERQQVCGCSAVGMSMLVEYLSAHLNPTYFAVRSAPMRCRKSLKRTPLHLPIALQLPRRCDAYLRDLRLQRVELGQRPRPLLANEARSSSL